MGMIVNETTSNEVVVCKYRQPHGFIKNLPKNSFMLFTKTSKILPVQLLPSLTTISFNLVFMSKTLTPSEVTFTLPTVVLAFTVA